MVGDGEAKNFDLILNLNESAAIGMRREAREGEFRCRIQTDCVLKEINLRARD